MPFDNKIKIWLSKNQVRKTRKMKQPKENYDSRVLFPKIPAEKLA